MNKRPRPGGKPNHRPNRHKSQPPERHFIYGLHAVRAALDNPRRKKRKFMATPNALRRLTEDAPLPAGTPEPEDTTPRQLDKLLGADAVHQGVALEVEPLDREPLSAFKDGRLIVILDQVTDPHNVGAILRTACAFGADALLTTARHAPRETGVMAKSASGALDIVPFIEVRNLGDAMEELQALGFRCIGFDSEADVELAAGGASDRTAIVLGAEGKGLRQKTRSLCDQLVRLNMPGPIKSLNVSNAAAIALFAVTRG